MTTHPELGNLSVTDYATAWLRVDRDPRELKDEYDRLRPIAQADGFFHALLAPLYGAWFAARCRRGSPPDALRKYSTDEAERFWARTVPGPDGHVYWTGGTHFRRNDGSSTRPLRWVWMREHGPIHPTTDVWTTCGEENCVSLRHLESGRVRRYRLWEKEHILGRMRVIALELGRSPTYRDWEIRREKPSVATIKKIFGSWVNAKKEAGLGPLPGSHESRISEQQIVRGIHALAELIGRSPTTGDWERHKAFLKSEGVWTSATTVRRRFGTWGNALKKAGL